MKLTRRFQTFDKVTKLPVCGYKTFNNGQKTYKWDTKFPKVYKAHNKGT